MPVAQRNQTSVPVEHQLQLRPLGSGGQPRAGRTGIKTQLDLAGDPPAWACGNKKEPYECDGYKPNVRLWKDFVKAAARHFKGRVNRFSLWNEPNWYTWISPHKKAPLLYRKLVQTGYKAIKKREQEGRGRHRRAGAALPAGHLDAAAPVHPGDGLREQEAEAHQGREQEVRQEAAQVRRVLDAPVRLRAQADVKRANKDELTIANLGALPKLLDKLRKKGLIKTKKKKFPIYLTEHGYMVADNPAVRPERRIPEAKRAKWIVQAWKIAQGTPRIKQMLHYELLSPPPELPERLTSTWACSSRTGTPRQSFYALRNWIQQAVADGEVSAPGPCSACS